MWSSADLPALATDPETALSLGQIWGEPCPSAWATQWDARDDVVPVDLDWIGEDADGVWCRYHPLMLLARDEDLSLAMARYHAVKGDITEADWDKLSAWEFEVKLTAVRARQREDARRMKVRDGK